MSENKKSTIRNPKRTVAIFGRIAGEDKDQGTVEIEFAPGVNLVVEADDVEQIEEYADPMTGIPVAKIILRDGVDAKAALRPKSFEHAQQRGDVPFAFGSTSPQFQTNPISLTPLPDAGPYPTPVPGRLPAPGRTPIPLPGSGQPLPGFNPFPPGNQTPGDSSTMSGTECMYATNTMSNKHFFGWIVDDGYGAGDIRYDDPS